jgi:multiple sugar transport system ATP-binding protein
VSVSQSSQASASVSVRNLALSYGAVSVLKALDLDILEGEFLVLLGASGCGKSTLLNCIAGLLEPSTGQIFIKGKNVTWAEPSERGIGMVFQSYALYPQMTVERNLSFGLRVSGMAKDEIKKRVDRAATMLQLGPLLDRKPMALSGGQRQRVAIGRALVRDVDVFLFDEPLSNLDAKLRAELRVELKRLHQKLGNTMIYVTHDQIEALTLADRIAVMKGGIIQQLDDPKTIFNRPDNLYVAGFIGSPSMNFFTGDISGSGGSAAFTVDGATIALASYPAKPGGLKPGKAILGLRPEFLRIGPPGPGEVKAFEALVDIIETMGTDSIVWLSHDGKTFSLRMDATKVPEQGAKVTVSVDIARASLFDVATELRL